MSCYSSYLEPHLTSITAYNPLSSHQQQQQQPGIASIMHAGKVIPYVPGMPGPHSLAPTAATTDISTTSSGGAGANNEDQPKSYKVIPGLPGLHVIPAQQPLDLASPVKCYNNGPLDLAASPKEAKLAFKSPEHLRLERSNNSMGTKLDERSSRIGRLSVDSLKCDVSGKGSRHKDFDKAKAVAVDKFTYPNGAIVESKSPSPKASRMESKKRAWSVCDESPATKMTLDSPPTRPSAAVVPSVLVNHDSSKSNLNNSEVPKSPAKCEVVMVTKVEETSTKFLRPNSLPLKPGTFTPKKHHGITPTANTLPLISPETPRPKKSYGQLYLNGHAYTYLGLKCSTRVFYCTLNRPQPMYVTQQNNLSMYSNWKICKESPPDLDMAHYDSRHRDQSYTVAAKRHEDLLTHSSQRSSSPTDGRSSDSDSQEKSKRVKIFDGGFESNEDYTYVRGRGELMIFNF